MSFISPEYVLFFCIVLPLFFVIPYRFRWIQLLAASYFFYAYGSGIYVLLIVFTTLVDYTAARLIGATQDRRRKRLFLAVSLGVNLTVLFLFKYFNFFNRSLDAALGALNIPYEAGALNVILPVGISFYTFQSMAYAIDVYRGKMQPEKHVGVFATFVAFFPQLVAGPIERAPHLLPQFYRRTNFDEERVISGLRLILWGFFKKVVIADRLAIYANAVYNQPHDYTGLPLILATVFFGFQIYCDFSAYSDIAIGTARIIGFDLMQNFRQPYFSQSVREFWGRWHISLSTWFRDYLYIPLGGSRVSLNRHLLNLFVVFLVSGLWHGASWTFVIWGGLHGLYVVAEAWLGHRNLALFPQHGGRRVALVKIAGTFALVTFAWIFFRANSFADAGYIVSHLLDFGQMGSVTAPFAAGLLGAQVEFVLSLALIALLLAVDYLDMQVGLNQLLALSPVYARWLVYYAAGAAVLFSGLYGTGAVEFIYFQF